MLVALALLGILTGMMVPFLQQWRVIDRKRTEMAWQAEVDALARYLEQAIAGAMPLPLLDKDLSRRFPMKGRADSIRFVTVARRGIDSAGLFEAEIAVRSSDGEKQLVEIFRQRRATEGAGPIEITLMDDIDAVVFRYLDAGGNDPKWTDSRTTQAGLPTAIRLSVSIERNGRKFTGNATSILALSGRK
jgi:hypothetical protein